MEICDLPTTVLLIKLVEEGDSAMGTVMLLSFLNAWKVQEPSSCPGEPSDHTLQDSLLILGHTASPFRQETDGMRTTTTTTTTTTTRGGGGGGWYTGVTECVVCRLQRQRRRTKTPEPSDVRSAVRFCRGKEVMLVNSDDLYISVDSTLLGTVL
ncbi:uncharacterized protein LOC126990953 isoform X2 [Eriocheir sinensis]|uniref:uncharacterized protein LOC126990953 isoform X2 n=1 Tax=Eriocheir sinensis TaxID=95602 RepID=UPI0021C730A2|nr:uncharacterized protein LOC126990953 isoform X2 [Eriocheir sinensis]